MTGRILLGAAGTLLVAGTVFLLNELQRRQRLDAPMLPVSFAHLDHQGVNCVTCHHNYVDTSGQGLCFDCHKTDPAVAALIESQFHDLCRDCHIAEQARGEPAGPTRACFACHEGDDAP